jgi:cytochrome c-type biogenesis protein CcmH/NrfG
MAKTRHVLIAGVGSIGLFFVIASIQESLLGKPPTSNFSPAQHVAEVSYQDPDLERLREATRIRPKERVVWMSLAQELLRKGAENVISRQEASLEAIGALREVLNINPEDSEALLLMADISFEMQAFTKATEFYGAYLKGNPEDDVIRSRYASSLTFTGRAGEAKGILQNVIERNPKAFQPRAFLAFALAELGEIEEMRKAGDEALALATDDRARAMLESFLQKIAQAGEGKDEVGGTLETTSTSTPQFATLKGTPSGLKVMDFLSKNPVAGPKLRGFQEEGSTLRVLLDNFPMEAMPPFAREKFLGGIREFLKAEKITDIDLIEFRDATTGKQEGTLQP